MEVDAEGYQTDLWGGDNTVLYYYTAPELHSNHTHTHTMCPRGGYKRTGGALDVQSHNHTCAFSIFNIQPTAPNFH